MVFQASSKLICILLHILKQYNPCKKVYGWVLRCNNAHAATWIWVSLPKTTILAFSSLKDIPYTLLASFHQLLQLESCSSWETCAIASQSLISQPFIIHWRSRVKVCHSILSEDYVDENGWLTYMDWLSLPMLWVTPDGTGIKSVVNTILSLHQITVIQNYSWLLAFCVKLSPIIFM